MRCRESLHAYALSVPIPLVSADPLKPDETLTGPARGLMAPVHAAILDAAEHAISTPFGRALIMAPPGSAKSTYCSQVVPTYAMGRKAQQRLLLTSYQSQLAERQSRRAIQIASSPDFRDIWAQPITVTKDAVSDWSLSNESECLAMGLMAGITGNRAHGAVVDDPVAGREEADSEDYRQKTVDAYQDDLLPRLLPAAWLILVQTRWHERDLAGSILPDDYRGESGPVKCRDGLWWHVLNIPAKAEHWDDPLGRIPGDYLWPEFYPPQHWQMFEHAQGVEAQRAWSSLYQQRPSPQGSGMFTRASITRYKRGELPPQLNFVGASDFAVTEKRGDFTEHGCCGIDPGGNMWFTDWWSGQVQPDEAIERFLDIVERRKARLWFNEGGVIDKSVRPSINRRMRERRVFTDLRSLSSMHDKLAKCSSFFARCGAGTVYMPADAPWADQVIDQLLSLPAGRYDDKADVCGLLGRAVDQFSVPQAPAPPKPRGIRPFSTAWLEWEPPKEPAVRYR